VTTILIVDDSDTARATLRQVLEADADCRVVGEASTGEQALRFVDDHDPDIVIMDVFLRRENGVDVTASIMSKAPRPVFILTGADATDPALVYRAMEAGALEVSAKLPSPRHPCYKARREQLVRRVKALADVPVVHRFCRQVKRAAQPRSQYTSNSRCAELVVVAASTGGPPVVHQLLNQLESPFPLPIAIVQHIAEGFTESFLAWLRQVTSHSIAKVAHTMPLEPGTVYFPASDRHLKLASRVTVTSSGEPPRNYQRPSADVLIESAVAHVGAAAIGVILTGMGSDGAQGLAALRRAGGFTIAQAPETCAVGSMPEQAIAAGAIDLVASPETIAPEIERRVTGGR